MFTIVSYSRYMCIRGSRLLQKSEPVDDFAIAHDRSKCLFVEQFQEWRTFILTSLFLSDLF